MTGTINPDGSAGPVGGIPLKIEGAKEKGLVRFGFPIGTRMSADRRNNTIVDVVEKARQQGLEVREIRDIYDAYNFLTGKSLARAEPLPEDELEPSPEMRKRLSARTLDWKARFQASWPGVARKFDGLAREASVEAEKRILLSSNRLSRMPLTRARKRRITKKAVYLPWRFPNTRGQSAWSIPLIKCSIS